MPTPTLQDLEKQAEELHRKENPALYGDDPAKGNPASADPKTPENPASADLKNQGLQVQQPKNEPPKEGDIEPLQHRLSVVSGMVRTESAERVRLKAEMETFRSENAALKAENTSLKSQLAKQEQIPASGDLIGKIREEMGNEFANGVEALIDQRTDQKIASLRQEFAPLQEQVKTVQTNQVKSASQRFFEDLAAEIPRFYDLNGTGNGDGNKDFLVWLAMQDPISGRTYQELLEEAHSVYDSKRAARIIKTWPGYAGFMGASPKPVSPKVPEELVTPEAKRGTVSDAPKPEAAITLEEIQKFQNDVARGFYRGREKEQKAMQARVEKMLEQLG